MGSLPEGYGLLSRKAEPHIDQLRVFTSMTMLHEMHHHSFYKSGLIPSVPDLRAIN